MNNDDLCETIQAAIEKLEALTKECDSQNQEPFLIPLHPKHIRAFVEAGIIDPSDIVDYEKNFGESGIYKDIDYYYDI